MGYYEDETGIEARAATMALALIQTALDGSGLTQEEVRKKLQVDKSFIPSLLSGNRPLTVRLMAAILFACGFEIRFSMIPTEKEEVA